MLHWQSLTSLKVGTLFKFKTIGSAQSHSGSAITKSLIFGRDACLQLKLAHLNVIILSHSLCLLIGPVKNWSEKTQEYTANPDVVLKENENWAEVCTM